MKNTLQRTLFFITTLLPLACLSQQKDSVFLYNGQILIGDIKSVELGILTIDDVDLKFQNIKLYKIKRLRTAQEFRIETNQKQVYFGALDATSEYGRAVIILSDGKTIPITIRDINTMVFLGKDFFKRLDGNIGAGFSFTKSSGVGQFNLNSSITYVTKDFENQLQASTIGSVDSSKYSRDNEDVELFTNYNLGSQWFIAGLAAYQRNLELSIARRFQEMIGAGNKIVLTKNLKILAVSGLAFNQEKSTDGVSSSTLLEVPVMMRLNFYKFQHPNIQIGLTQTVYIGITEKGRIRQSGSTDFSWELIHNFSLTINLYSNYDNKPPANANGKTDYGMVIGLSYKF